MPHREQPSFYLYNRGYELQLGQLVLGNYKTPTRVPHCKIGPLSGDDLRAWVQTTPLRDAVFTKFSAWNVDTELEVMETGMMGGKWSTENSRIVNGRSGQRLEIKSDKVQDFFLEKVMTSPGVKERLKKWLSVSRTKYVLYHARLKPQPQVWCLTGLIELSDATVATVVTKSPSVTLGISSIIPALAGVPLGAGVSLGTDHTVTCDARWPETSVWAAQYQLINTRRALQLVQDASPINYVMLVPDFTYAPGQVLGGKAGAADKLQLEVLPVEDIDVEEEEALHIDSFNDEYWTVYLTAETEGEKLGKFGD